MANCLDLARHPSIGHVASDTPSETLVRLTIIENIFFREFPKWLSYPPFPLSYGKAFIVSGALSHLGWGGPLTFTIMMVAQRVVVQSLFFKRLIEIAGGADYLDLARHPSTGHMASLRLCPDTFHQLGTSSSDPIVNGQLPRALPRLHDAF